MATLKAAQRRAHNDRRAQNIGRWPQVLGGDMAGVVEEADQTSRFQPGDKVRRLRCSRIYS